MTTSYSLSHRGSSSATSVEPAVSWASTTGTLCSRYEPSESTGTISSLTSDCAIAYGGCVCTIASAEVVL